MILGIVKKKHNKEKITKNGKEKRNKKKEKKYC